MSTEQTPHLDRRDGLWVPPELRSFNRQIVFRTPRSTIVHFGSDDLEPYYGMIDESHFGTEEDLYHVQNPELVPDSLTIKKEGEEPVEFRIEQVAIPDGGQSEAVTDAEDYLVREMAEPSQDGSETLVQHASTLVAFLAVHRWGEDLERRAGRQRYGHFEQAAEEAMDDLAAGGYLPVVGESVLNGVEIVVEAIEETGLVDRNEPGGLVERVGGGGGRV